ncbi:Adenosine/AMP deaminase domain [Macleaya cordata]|uniref:AMP deaminase n=1 Tax=Macleaya cordata TaxID=56857 RepID=A0A200QNK0_MACCD|nr:Adenosine/AMP deaminase domain [Macleaya cordata]
MDSSCPSASSLQLAMAAFVGASLMAISAFYIHKRSVDQILERLIELHSEIERRLRNQRFSRSLDNHGAFRYRMSSSLPNVALMASGEEVNLDHPIRFSQSSSSFSNLNSIPLGLPPLQTTQRDGSKQSLKHSGSRTRLASVGIPSTPKSAGGTAFESLEESEDEDTLLSDEEDNGLSYDNVDSAPLDYDASSNIQGSTVVPFEVAKAHSSQDQKYGATISRSLGNTNVHDNQNVVIAPMLIGRKDTTDILIPLTSTPYDAPRGEEVEVCKMIRECLELRKKYVYRENVPWIKEITEPSTPLPNKDPFHFDPIEPTEHYFKMEDGVVHVYANKDETEELYSVASSTTFFTDMHHILRVLSLGNVRTACHHRLRLLEEKFRLHMLVNADREFLAQKSAPHRDFYNVRKVDTHIHHSACMNQKHLLRFIKSKLKKEPDEVVIFRDGKYLTLKEVFESLDLTGYDLNVDLLDVHADKNTFHRFDKFNLKYNPCGQSRLREIFLKQDNLIQGRFLAEVTKEVLSDLEASKYQMAEYRVSIYGRKQSEWDQLASWFINNELHSENAVWLIQLPRLYNIYRKMGTATSFQNILDNVFLPLFEVTVDPNSHPQLHVFLKQVVGFDLVDDESKPERRPTKHMPKPAEWTNEFNPAYSYYAYYCYANLYTLNKLRESKGLTTIKLRPHCGEAGDIDHLAAAFLLCHNIAHGNNLRKSPVLQYLYYLAQIGLAMSPLSNNSLFLDYHRNPFPMFFQRGLNVSLSTDDPLQIHLTKEPLVEEYSVAAQVWKLTACDICEIARNSVYQSGFSHVAKLHWLGDKYFKKGPEGNDIHKTNVPHLRIAFRHETWKEEMQFVCCGRAVFPEEVEP